MNDGRTLESLVEIRTKSQRKTQQFEISCNASGLVDKTAQDLIIFVWETLGSYPQQCKRHIAHRHLHRSLFMDRWTSPFRRGLTQSLTMLYSRPYCGYA